LSFSSTIGSIENGFNRVDPNSGLVWLPSEGPEVESISTEVKSVLVERSYSAILENESLVDVNHIDFKSDAPRIIPIKMRRPARPKTRQFFFVAGLEDDSQTNRSPSNESKIASRQVTKTDAANLNLFGPVGQMGHRIRPPKDMIKLEDRLGYILQPPLENLLSESRLGFPFEPFSYQWEGIAFLYPRSTAILADEMGLGKTMQAITTVRLLLHRKEIRQILLVCPKPLVTNWQREFEIWAPEIPTTVIEGNQESREWKWHLSDIPVKIANYELLHRDQDYFESDHEAMQYDLVILDESQRIKNRNSATSHATRAIKSRRHWALTGTPVENSSEDLVGIFEFLSPGFLSSDMRPRKMGRAVSDYVLRRTKDMVEIDLPPKLFRDAEVTLSPEQQAAYELAESDGVVKLNRLGEELSIQHVFELVLRLKQICNFDPVTGSSSKLERLEADLEEVAESGRKAIVFSQWVKTLDRLKEPLKRFGPLEYHGRIPSNRRDAVIDQFRDDPDSHVLLISYGAGAVGLNLQFASYVFLFDRWWNPAVEDQAINRVHRIGSSGPVTVTRFLAMDSIEERINRVLEEKRELFDIIFSDAVGAKKMNLNQEEIFGLFDLKKRPSSKAA
jgi:SNF2 family DNA or RNA helicase